MIIVSAVSANIHHEVDRTGTTKHFATRHGNLPVVEMGLFLSRVGPIDSRLTQRGSGGRVMNGRKVIIASRFEDEDRGFRVFGQRVSQDPTRRTSSNTNIVLD